MFGITWTFLLNPVSGLVNVWTEKLFGLAHAPFNIYTMQGMVFVQGLNSFPLAFLLMVASLRSMNSSFEEAARISGAGPLRSSLGMTLALARPAIIAAFLLNLIRGAEAFEVPAIVGVPARINVLTTYIYERIEVTYPPNYSLGAAVGVSLLTITITILVVYRLFTRRSERFVTITGGGYRASPIDIGKLKYFTAALAVLLLIIIVVLPIGILLIGSLEPVFVLPTFATLAHLSLSNYRLVFSDYNNVTSLKNTFILAITGATLVMFLSILISYIGTKAKPKGAPLLGALAFLPYAMPGTVLGVGLLWAYVGVKPLYETLYVLLIAYATRFIPYGIWSTDSAMLQIHSELEEASMLSGAGFLRRLKDVFFPLLIPSFIAGWTFVFSVIIRELSSSIFLIGPKSNVAAVQVYSLYTSGYFSQTASLGIILIVVSLILVVLARVFARSWVGRVAGTLAG